MSEPFPYDDDFFYPEPDTPTVDDIAAVISAAVEHRVQEHALEHAAETSQVSIAYADQAMAGRYADYDKLRPQVEEALAAAGYNAFSFATPQEAEYIYESTLLRLAAEENQRRADEAREQPKKDWETVRAAYLPNPWTSS